MTKEIEFTVEGVEIPSIHVTDRDEDGDAKIEWIWPDARIIIVVDAGGWAHFSLVSSIFTASATLREAKP